MYSNKDDWHLFSTYDLQVVIPHILPELTNLIIMETLYGRYYYCPNIINKEREVMNCEVTFPRPQD